MDPRLHTYLRPSRQNTALQLSQTLRNQYIKSYGQWDAALLAASQRGWRLFGYRD